MRKILHFRVAGQFAQKEPQPLLILEPHLSARKLLAASSEAADSSRDTAALPNDNPFGDSQITPLHIFGGATWETGRCRLWIRVSDWIFELEAYLPGKFVDAAHPVLGFALKIGNLQCHLAGKQQCCNRALDFVSQSLLHLLPDQQDLPLIAKKGGAQLARDPVHTVDGEVHMNRNGCADMFQHLSLSTGSVSMNA